MKKYLIALAGVFALGTAVMTTQASAESYKVEKGDTLWNISQDQNVTVEELKDWNDLDSNVIVPSQKLEVSTEPYKVKKGDTLIGISKETGVSVKDLKANNNLTNDTIIAGETISLNGTSNHAKAKVDTVSNNNSQTPAKAQPIKKQAVANTKSTPNTQPTTSQAKPSSGKTLTVTATAYTADCAGCSGVTATGINVKSNPNMKVIAVDPRIIPLGSKVWVEGYGTAIAGDTGGAIKGHRIDLLMANNGQANSWGVRTVTIKVLD